MGATIKIAILAQAAQAKREMRDVSDEADDMGDRVQRSLKGFAGNFAKAAAPIASITSLIGPLTNGILGLVKGMAAVGQGVAAMAPLAAFAPSVVGGWQFLKFTIAGIGEQMAVELKPVGAAFKAAQVEAGNLATQGIDKVAASFQKVNLPNISAAMDRIGVSTNQSVTQFGKWVNSAPGIKLIKDTTDGVASAFEKAAPHITAAAISLGELGNRADVAERLGAVGVKIGELADKFKRWADSVTAGDVDGALRKAGDAVEFFSGKLAAVRGAIDWLAQNQDKITAISDGFAAFGIALGLATGNPVAVAVGAFTLLSNHLDDVKRALDNVPSSVWTGLGDSVAALGGALREGAVAFLDLAKALTGSDTNMELFLKAVQLGRAAIDVLTISVQGAVAGYRTLESAVFAVIAGYKLLTGDLDGAKEAWARSKTAADQATDAAAKQVQGVKDLKANWEQGGAAIKTANEKAAAAAVLAAKQTGDAHDRAGTQAAAAHTSAATKAVAAQTAIAGGAAGAATTVSSSHQSAATKTSSYWSVVPGQIKGYFANTSLSSAGSSIMNSFMSGAQAVWNNTIAPWLRARAAEIANLKGPPAKDRVLLQEAGELVMGGFLHGLESQYGVVRASLTGFTGSLSAAVKAGEPDLLATAADVAKGVVTAMGKRLDSEKPGLLVTAAAVAKAVTDAMGKKLDDEKPGLLVTAGNVAQGVVKALADSTVKNTPTATQAAANLGKEVFSALQREAQVQPFSSLGANIVNAFATGINGASQNASSAIANVVSNALNAARSALGIASPSKPAMKMGQQTGQGYILGLQSQQAAVRAAAQDLFDIPSAVAPSRIDVTRPIGGIPAQAGPAVLELRSSGSRVDDLLLELLRRSVRARGGNVQVALMGGRG